MGLRWLSPINWDVATNFSQTLHNRTLETFLREKKWNHILTFSVDSPVTCTSGPHLILGTDTVTLIVFSLIPNWFLSLCPLDMLLAQVAVLKWSFFSVSCVDGYWLHNSDKNTFKSILLLPAEPIFTHALNGDWGNDTTDKKMRK